jgi:hypothetical protein
VASNSPARPTPYTFLLAASHSGSTLLAMLLNAHPDIATVGEVSSGASRDLDGYRCSCRRVITDCDFWTRVSAAVRADHPRFDLADFGIRFEIGSPAWVNRLVRIEHRGALLETCRDLALAASPAWRRHFAATGATLRDLAAAVLREANARVFVDSSKLAHRLKFVRRVNGLDVKVIHLVRDGRAVALTYMDADTYADSSDPALRRGGRGPSGAPQQPRLPMADAAEEWLRSIRSAEYALAGMRREQWMRIRYEDLCRQPRQTLARVCAFLGVDPDAADRSFRSVEHHVVGNGMRLDATAEVRLDERWRSALSGEDLATFDRVAGAVNRRYYPDADRSGAAIRSAVA